MRRTYSRRHVLRMGAGLAGAAMLPACGGDGASDGGASTPATEPPLRLRTRTPTGGEPSGLLRLGVLDRGDARRLTRDEQLLTYSRLVGLDPRSTAVYGDLAESIELAEPLLVRVRLKQDMYFHPGADGEADRVTAEAVRRDFERRREEAVYLFTDVVESVDAPNADELLIRLRAPFALLFEHLDRPEACVRSDRPYVGLDDRTGSGPFVPASRTPWGQGFVPSAQWPGGTGIEEIEVVRAETERDLDALFGNRAIDVRVHPDAASRTAAASRTGIQEVTRPSQRLRGFGLSLIGQKDGSEVRHVPAFQDQRVRRAVSIALDREALREVDGSLSCGPVGPAHGGDALPPIELQSHALYRHDPGAARALLAAAEHEGLGFRILHPDTPSMIALAQRVAEQLREGGFEPRLQSAPSDLWEASFVRGDFETALFELTSLDTPDLGLRLHTSGGLSGRFSLWGYSNPVYDAAVRDTLSQINPAARARRAREAQRLLLEDVPAMFPIGAPVEHASVTASLRGYEFDAYDFNAGYLASRWTMENGPGREGEQADDSDDAEADAG